MAHRLIRPEQSRWGRVVDDQEYGKELGQPGACISLGTRLHHSRNAGLWLVDESHSRAAGPFLLSQHPRRYRLHRAPAHHPSPDLADHESDAGIASRYTALAAD